MKQNSQRMYRIPNLEVIWYMLNMTADGRR